MAARAESRAAFVRNALDYCAAHGMQGIDLDWEFPKDEREERDYGLLLRDLRSAFEPRGWSVFLTIAPEQNPTTAAFAAADFVQIMSYDRGVRHATFEAAEKHVRELLESGVPASKLVLGLPFYGRKIADRMQARSYRDILRDYSPPPAADEAGGYYFNGQETIRRKTRFAREKGLAGVMFWQLAQDAPGERSLLGAIIDSLPGQFQGLKD
jgi:chitinase